MPLLRNVQAIALLMRHITHLFAVTDLENL